MAEAMFVGSIGSSQAELSKYILDDSDILLLVKKTMEGYIVTIDDEGRIAFEKGDANIRVYNKGCIAFVIQSLSQALNKNLKLSSYDKTENKPTAQAMCDDFVLNLYVNMKSYGIFGEDITLLTTMYRNYVDQAMRRPLNESDKRFLSTTTQEQTVRQQQDINQSSNRGLFGNIFGGKRDE